jgi:hypothetical protein
MCEEDRSVWGDVVSTRRARLSMRGEDGSVLVEDLSLQGEDLSVQAEDPVTLRNHVAARGEDADE